MSKKVKFTVTDKYWIEKLLKDELRNCRSFIELYPCPTRSHIIKEVGFCKERVIAYEKLCDYLERKM